MSSFSPPVSTASLPSQPSIGRTHCAMPLPPSSFGIYSLSGAESRRRLWHMAPGALAIPLQFVPHRDPLSATLWWIIMSVIAVVTTHIFLRFRRIRRNSEDLGTSAITGYAVAVLLTIVLLPDRLEVGLAVLAILAFGDGSASLFGQLFRGPVLPWNPGKSWSGLTAFLLIGGLLTAWVYWGETQNPEAQEPALDFTRALLLTAPAVAACAFIESLPSRINDNIRVGITAAIGLSLLSLCR
jgi:dolichol kinase